MILTVAASSLVWVSPKLFSRVSLLLCFYTLLKTIKHETQLAWKSEYQEMNHDILFLLFYDEFTGHNEGELIDYTMR